MAEMKKAFKEFMNKHGRSESGFTMAEILVAIALLAVLTAVVTSTIINATQTSDKFSRGTLNESQLLNAVSLVTRDISLANEVTYASATALAVDTMEGGTPAQVFYFYWTGNVSSIPSDAAYFEVKNNASKISQQPGIVEYRIVGGDTSNPTIRTIIEGYNPGGNSEYPLFSYHDSNNAEILLDATNPPQVASNKLGNIRRVEIHFTSYIDSRDNAMEMHTSASPRFLGQLPTDTYGVGTPPETPTPILNGELLPQTNVADLSWTRIAGATGYTVYRENRLQSPLVQVVGSTTGKNSSTLSDPNRAWGETYEYFVIAHGWAGDSNPSSKIRLRVTPQPTAFINIDPLRASPITNYTVARDLNNQITWAPSTGDTIKYKLYTVAGATKTLVYDGTATTYLHSGRSYGASTIYVVVAYNDTIPGHSATNPTAVTGGNSVDSTPVTLVSPPLKPTLSGVARNDLTSPSTALATNILTVSNDASNPSVVGYEFRHGDTDASATNTVGQRSTAISYSHLPGWGTTKWYSVRAYNDAGNSQYSDDGATLATKLDQIPGPFSISSLTNNTGYGNVVVQGTDAGSLATVNTTGVMNAAWTTSAGTVEYDVDRWISNGLGAPIMSKAYMDWEADKPDLSSATLSTNFADVHPGVVYGVQVRATAQNGLTRPIVATLLTRPDVPRRGITEATCLANNSQTYGMYVTADTRAKNGYANQTSISFAKSSGGAATQTVNVGTSVSSFQTLNFNQEGKITYQNIISRGAVADTVANFGISDSERVSYPLTLDMQIVGHFSGCTSAGRAVPTSIAPAQGGSTWVTAFDVCYGYLTGHDYSGYYVDPNNRNAKGYIYQDYADGYQDSFVRKNVGGCSWRLHPKTGREPYWDSVG